MEWYYAVNGQQQGPVDWDTLVSLVRGGQLKRSDLVWNASMGQQWAKAATVAGLFEPAAPVPTGTPPPASEWSADARFQSATPNRDLMASARSALEGQWGLAVGANLVYFLVAVAMGIIPYLGNLISFVVSGPLALGWYLFFLTLSRRQPGGIGMIFQGFRQFGTAFLACLLMGLLILAWMLPALVLLVVVIVMGLAGLRHPQAGAATPGAAVFLLIPLFIAALVPAIIAQYRYSMTYFVVGEMPGIGALEAIRHSTRMMSGNKWKLFCLQWRFFGWGLLCCLTFGIGFLWLVPYIMTSLGCFYDDLRKGQTSP